MAKTSDFFDRLIDRLDRLDPSSVQNYMLKLVRERGLFSTIFQTIHEGILIIDRQLRVQFANAAATDMLGLPELTQGRDAHKISRYLRDLNWDRLMSQDPREWERAARQEIEVVYPQHRILQFYLLPYQNEFDQDQELGMAIILLYDVTDLREQATHELESERLNAITMLAAGVAHEIGNPLNSLNLHLHLLDRLLRRQPASTDLTEAREMVATATQEVRRLDGIISQYLKAIRPAPLDVQSVQLTAVMDDTLRLLHREIEDRGVSIACDWPTEVPEIMGDANQLKQVFYNLIRNAIQAMPDGGKLRLSITLNDQVLAVGVHDTGRGISPEALGKLFTPYYTTKPDGTGLGLVIVARILRAHGAQMGVESEVNRGTTFTLRFPRRDRRTRLLTGHEAPVLPALATPPPPAADHAEPPPSAHR